MARKGGVLAGRKLGPGSKVEWASSLFSDNLSRFGFFEALGPGSKVEWASSFSDFTQII